MTANLHISPEVKSQIDMILPSKIGKAKVTYDDFLSMIIYLLKDVLQYEIKDVTNLIAEYQKVQLEKMEL